MKKKILLLPLCALLLGSCSVPFIADAAEKGTDVPAELKELLSSYKDANGMYTKKTTICLNEASIGEMSKYFHASQTQAKRTTYYDDPNQRLLMAKPDGTLDASYGGYRFVTDHIERFHIGEGATLETMFTNTVKDFDQGTATGLNDKYTNLAKFTANGYFTTGEGGWAYESEHGSYFHNFIAKGDKYFGDMLGFAAPMLLTDSGNYLKFKSVTVRERMDADANKYLSIRIYLQDEDSGKLTGECGGALSEARIYKGIRPVGEEDLSVGYYLVKGNEKVGKFSLTTEEGKNELVLKDVELFKDDAVKLWSTDGQYHGCSQGIEHNLTVEISKNSKLIDDQDNYVICEDAEYNFYAKFDDNWNYIGTYVKDQAARVVYCEANWDDIDSGKMFAHYWGDDVIDSEWDYKPHMVYDHKTGYGKNVCKVVIPGKTSNIKFCYNKTSPSSDFVQSENQALGTDNSYYFSDWNGGTPKMEHYNYTPAA